MADDKGNPAPDPWANIDSGQTEGADDGFSFSFDALEEPAADAEVPSGGFSLTTDDDDEPLPADMFAAEPAAAPEAAASHDAASDLAAADDLAADWLASPPASTEPAADLADDLADELSPAVEDDDPFSFVAADRGSTAESIAESSLVAGSSAIEIGTGQSGVTSESDIVADDTSVGNSGAFDFGEADDSLPAGAEPGPFDATAFAETEPVAWPAGDDEPGSGESGDEFGFGAVVEEAEPAAESLAMGAAAGATAAVATAAKKARAPAQAKPAKQGGLGQMIGVVLGGLMALPITYAILIWGFGKDPFKFTKSVPPDLAFLLPAKFQPGARPAGLPKLDRAPSLDDVAQSAPAEVPEVPPAEPEPSEPGLEPEAAQPAAEPGDLADLAAPERPATEPIAAAAAPEPAPLDLSAVEQAVTAATEAIDAVAAVEADDPARKKMLVGWYKKLAKVGEELALLETVAADSGRPLAAAPDAVAGLYGRIADSEGLVEDLKRLCRDWVAFRKRPADGVLLVAMLDDVKKVGPYWCSTVSLEMADGSTKQVSVISRIEPQAAAGDRAVVAGVVFDDDVVWATDCRRLEAATTADLF